MWELEKLSTMTDNSSESNPFFLVFHSWREYMAYPFLWNCAEKKGLFLVWPLGGLFIAFQLSLLEILLSLLVLYFCLEKSVVGTLIQFRLTLSSLKTLCTDKTPNIRITVVAKNRWVQNQYGGIFTYFQINLYGLECFSCVWHDSLLHTFHRACCLNGSCTFQ